MSTLKEKLQNREKIAGAHVILTDPCIAEMIAN